ncbi:hypothetical protein WDU94_012577 [Cyamophila willieti]
MPTPFEREKAKKKKKKKKKKNITRNMKVSFFLRSSWCSSNYYFWLDGLTKDSKELLKQYEESFENDPFADETIQFGEELLISLTEAKKNRWCDLMESLDMKGNSRRAYKLLKNLSNDPTQPEQIHTNVTPDQVAHQLLKNGKTNFKVKNIKIKREINENHFLEEPFTVGELQEAIKMMKSKVNKAAGVDDIRTEQLKNFGPETLKWVTSLCNNCVTSLQIPKTWRKAHIVPLVKPGKDPDDPKNYRPVSLLCHLFKVLERMTLNRITSYVDEKLIPQQAGFRPGKSCCAQILNLTQHIEDGYERNEITGVAFLDLSAAYDTVNHCKLTSKIFEVTKDYTLTRFIQCLLQNRRYYVSLCGKKSRWRKQKNGLPQGSVLSPTLFNIYTNDQPAHKDTINFIYADDTAVAAQGGNFESVERKLESALQDLSSYYLRNNLKPNPKTKFSYTKKKVSARNNIIKRLTGTTWGANAHVLRTSAIALSLSAAEYSAAVWRNSAHAKQVDVAINDAVRSITGCLRPTPLEKVYQLAGIAPPNIRRRVAAEVERLKQTNDPRHPLHGHISERSRLRSRKSFLKKTQSCPTSPEVRRLKLWEEETTGNLNLQEELAVGHQLPYAMWKTLNRLRTGVTRCKVRLKQWGYTEEDSCDCGAIQDEAHLLSCPDLPEPCTLEDLQTANTKAIDVVTHWRHNI